MKKYMTFQNLIWNDISKGQLHIYCWWAFQNRRLITFQNRMLKGITNTCFQYNFNINFVNGIPTSDFTGQFKLYFERTYKNEQLEECPNQFLKTSAFTSKYRDIIGYTNSPEAVSTDFYSSPFATIIDSQATIAEGNQVTLYCWYDNEYGYSKQVLNLTKKVASIQLPRFPLAIDDSV